MLLNFILIPIIGLNGAALSTFITYFIQALFIYFIAKRLISFKIDIDYLFILHCIISSAIMLLAISLIEINSIPIYVATSFIIGIITYFVLTYLLIWKNQQYDLRHYLDGIKFD